MNFDPVIKNSSIDLYHESLYETSQYPIGKLNIITCDSLPDIVVKKGLGLPKIKIRSDRLNKLYKLIEEKAKGDKIIKLGEPICKPPMWNSKVIGNKIAKKLLRDI